VDGNQDRKNYLIVQTPRGFWSHRLAAEPAMPACHSLALRRRAILVNHAHANYRNRHVAIRRLSSFGSAGDLFRPSIRSRDSPVKPLCITKISVILSCSNHSEFRFRGPDRP
jgi:hypothetical protein